MTKSEKFQEVIKMAYDNLLKEAKKHDVAMIMSYSVRHRDEKIEQCKYGYAHNIISIHDAAAHEKYVRDNVIAVQ